MTKGRGKGNSKGKRGKGVRSETRDASLALAQTHPAMVEILRLNYDERVK